MKMHRHLLGSITASAIVFLLASSPSSSFATKQQPLRSIASTSTTFRGPNGLSRDLGDKNRSIETNHNRGITSEIVESIRETDSRVAEFLDSIPLESFGRSSDSPLPMNYGIFRGTSSLRSLSKNQNDLLCRFLAPSNAEKNHPIDHKALALLFVLGEHLEAAHELVLGVTPRELEAAEHAATHPGQTTWARDHPLDATADWIHAIVHRLEGSSKGEGGATGYDNAKHWFLGGAAKRLDRPDPSHPVRKLLAESAPRIAPLLCEGRRLLGPGTASPPYRHNIPGFGTAVEVELGRGEWDDLAFVELCRRRESQLRGDRGPLGSENELSDAECLELVDLQRFELLCLLHHVLQAPNGRG